MCLFFAYLSGISSNRAACAGWPFPLVVLENDQRQTGEKSKVWHRNRRKSRSFGTPRDKGDSLFKIIKNITPMPG